MSDSVYVWNVNSRQTVAYALTYDEALEIVRKMKWTEPASWKTGGKYGKRGYIPISPLFLESLSENPSQFIENTWDPREGLHTPEMPNSQLKLLRHL